MLAGHLIKSDMDIEKKLNYMFFAGFLCVLAGYTWDLFFPINKNLWTSSYVLFTSGWAMMGLAACVLMVDVLGYDRWAKFGVIYGSNAITVYVFAGMFPWLLNQIIGFQDFFYNGLVGLGMVPELASFLYAITYALICFIPAYILYKKKIFIKI